VVGVEIDRISRLSSNDEAKRQAELVQFQIVQPDINRILRVNATFYAAIDSSRSNPTDNPFTRAAARRNVAPLYVLSADTELTGDSLSTPSGNDGGTSKTGTVVAGIVLGVIGFLVIVVVILVAVLIVQKKKKRKADEESGAKEKVNIAAPTNQNIDNRTNVDNQDNVDNQGNDDDQDNINNQDNVDDSTVSDEEKRNVTPFIGGANVLRAEGDTDQDTNDTEVEIIHTIPSGASEDEQESDAEETKVAPDVTQDQSDVTDHDEESDLNESAPATPDLSAQIEVTPDTVDTSVTVETRSTAQVPAATEEKSVTAKPPVIAETPVTAEAPVTAETPVTAKVPVIAEAPVIQRPAPVVVPSREEKFIAKIKELEKLKEQREETMDELLLSDQTEDTKREMQKLEDDNVETESHISAIRKRLDQLRLKN